MVLEELDVEQINKKVTLSCDIFDVVSNTEERAKFLEIFTRAVNDKTK